jgi:uncharacterized protein (DUF2141 family)
MTLCPRRALFLCCAFLCLSARMWAATPDAPSAGVGNCSLIIHVTGFHNTKGKLGAELFTSSAGWPEDVDKSYRHDHFPIEGDHATARFDHLPPGRYGVVVLHDENENKKLDRNLLQVPKEGFGFANNPHVFLAAPPLEKATIPVTCPSTTTEVHLIYK